MLENGQTVYWYPSWPKPYRGYGHGQRCWGGQCTGFVADAADQHETGNVYVYWTDMCGEHTSGIDRETVQLLNLVKQV